MKSGQGHGSKVNRMVELLISCQDLADLDVFTKTDSMCVLFVKQFGQWREHARTEAIRNSLNPKFVEPFLMEYHPTMQQSLMFSVYDIDSRSSDLRHHDFVGSVEVKLEELVDESKHLLTTVKSLRVPGDPKVRGLIQITSEFVRFTRGKIQVQAVGHKFETVGLLRRKPDSFLEVGREIDSITYHPVFRTEIQTKSRNPWWRPFEISIQRLCNDDWDRPLQFSCWHANSGGRPPHEMIGKVLTTLRKINDMKSEIHFRKLPLVSPKKEKQKKKDVWAGDLRLYQFRVDMQYSLNDYVRGGLHLRLIIAVDFTASNGAITDTNSLHNLTPTRENQYLNVIESLGGIISRYDAEQRIGVYGFGAKLVGQRTPSFCFPLTPDNWVKGVAGAIQAYQSIVPSLTFAGPTYIAPVLRKVINITKTETSDAEHSPQNYYVLLIITDGIINDVDKTVEMLVKASTLPLSVVFLSVGPLDLFLMEQFHTSLHTPLFDGQSKCTAVRPNTHFAVFKRDAISSGSSVATIQETLSALSSQVLQYMKMKNISPGKPRKDLAIPNMSAVGQGQGNGLRDGEITEVMMMPTSKVEISTKPGLHKSKSMPFLPDSSHSSWKPLARRISVFSLTGPVCPTCGTSIETGPLLMADVHL